MHHSSPYELFPEIDQSDMRELLMDLFEFERVNEFSVVHGGYMSQNYRVETDKGPFFLKQYRNRMNTIVHEIKTAEQFFAKEGLPIITPIQDRYGREAFWMKGNWYSLFLFIDKKQLMPVEMTPVHIAESAKMLAMFHQTGNRFPLQSFQMLRTGNPRKFLMESVTLLRLLDQRKPLTELEETILTLLQYKIDCIEKKQLPPSDFQATYRHLLHGDFQYLNLFFNEDASVSHVFDLERSCLGWPAHEVVRSAIINSFDGGWDESHFALARHHVATYREYLPLTKEVYRRAVNFYAFNVIHTTWIEARYLIYHIDTQLALFNRHVKRVKFFSTENLDEFTERTFV